ncbi:MAG: CysS/YqeB C-terminal domain-containing protein [Candidatus Limnocylindrales bacterium]
MSGPRILAIMGSGETAPAMAKVHRALLERLDDSTAPATLIDTPYGFQENADELSARIVAYFVESVGHTLSVATYRSRDADALATSTALALIREARYVLAGPGSPSYALRHWVDGPIPGALTDKLANGGIVTVASAAALTVGVVTVPVYEIYKVGEDPHWLDGLDLLGQSTGLKAAVVPHYDNAEGGNHDTRFCYLGERRLRVLEAALPQGAFVLGVDGHTALVLDLDQGTASVAGLGGVTLRAQGRSVVFPSGTETRIEALAESARTIGRSTGWLPGTEPATVFAAGTTPAPRGSLPDTVAQREGTFVQALEAHDARAAAAALLELDSDIEGHLRAGEDSPDLDSARATFRALVVRLAGAAEAGVRDPREAVDPFIEALLELRARARAAQDWSAADFIRERLTDAGVAVHDSDAGSTWDLRT